MSKHPLPSQVAGQHGPGSSARPRRSPQTRRAGFDYRTRSERRHDRLALAGIIVMMIVWGTLIAIGRGPVVALVNMVGACILWWGYWAFIRWVSR